MSDFEKAFNQLSKVGLENHTELWGEPKTERAFFEAGKASKQAEIDGLKAQLSLQRDRNKALETELTSSRNYGDKLNERIRKVSWLLGNNSFERTIKNCLKILRGENESS